MSKRYWIAAGIASTIAVGTAPASATSIFFNQGSYSYPYNTTAQVFQSFETAPAGQAYVAGANESDSNTSTVQNVFVENTSIPGLSADPDAANNTGPNYLNIRAGGSYTVDFTTPVQFFSYVLGSLDAYNQVTINFESGAPLVLTGDQIVGGTSVLGSPSVFGSTGNSNIAGRVVYDQGGGAGITSVVFSSSGDSFELDGLASAVPEPATWGFMVLGIGAIGASFRASRRRKVPAHAFA